MCAGWICSTARLSSISNPIYPACRQRSCDADGWRTPKNAKESHSAITDDVRTSCSPKSRVDSTHLRCAGTHHRQMETEISVGSCGIGCLDEYAVGITG